MATASSPSTPIITVPDADDESIAILERIEGKIDLSGLELRIHMGVPASDDEWIERTAGADGMLLGWHVPDAALASTDRLKVISYLGTGASDHVNLGLAADRGMEVLTVSGYGDDAVAEHAAALMMAAVRSVPQLDRAVRAGEWPSASSWQIRGRRLGVVGLGGIGRRMVEIGRGLGMDVVAWNRSAESGATEIDGIPLLPMSELFATSDAVSLHVPLNEHTRGLVGEQLLRSMKPDAVLVNTARGAVVDEEALLRVLDDGAIRAAALDVFGSEPLAGDSRLRDHERAIVTPHVAFNTTDASERLFIIALQNLVDFFSAKG
ncbi:2-hydroxyacid dehydrogenase [Ruicaihuangia caeni]|uniref:NAD(P)-dependent oxidoreductase n=1 Tax=Ruicaihuangia caeni TaxID=3042517 RepID=A0AAW6T6T3_9MICO|nr:NAD(P)-dependent oxidoreductase [Klugiella sp. YN-L-19]MDI2099209.1 NAD(P)-dependent oxidoreductase [Klugiella sp. YN-L-19]